MSKQVPASALNANDATRKGALGQVYMKEGKTYRYWKVKDLALAANNVVEYSTTESAVTKDRSGGSSLGRVVAGVAYATVSAGNHGWIQTEGVATMTVPGGVTVTAGDYIIPHATGDGGVNKATTATRKDAFAIALTTDTATTTAGTVTGMLIRV